MSLSARSVVPVWFAAALGAVVVGLTVPQAALSWLPVVMGASILLTFVIQLGVSRKEGLVERIAASVGGALAVLALATLLIWATTGFTAGNVSA